MSVRIGNKIVAGMPEKALHGIGEIFTTTDTGVIAGAVEANGGSYNLADYNSGTDSIASKLTAGTLSYVSKAEFQTQVANTGACDSFGWDGATDPTFLVPKLNPWHVGKNAPVVGNGNNIGWTDGTTEYAGVGQTYQGVGITGIFGKDETKRLPASGTGQGYQPDNNKMYGLSTDPTKSGMIADLSETTNLRVMVQLATGATDQALETCTSVLADVAGLKDMSNVTATGKETVVGWGMPDYTAGIALSTAINTPQLIQCDGLLLAYENSAYVQIDLCNSSGTTIVANLIANSGYAGAVGGGSAFVSKGSYIKNITAPTAIVLYPLKGVN